MGKSKSMKSSSNQKNKKSFFDESDSEDSSFEEQKSSKKTKQSNFKNGKKSVNNKIDIFKYLEGNQKKNKNNNSSDDSDDSDNENYDLKCHNDYSSYSTSSSGTSSEEVEPLIVKKYSEKNKQIENKPLENDKIQTVVYTFSVMPTKNKNSKDFFTITSDDLKIESCTNEEDIEKSQNYKERASLNSDIVTSLKLNIRSEYAGMVTFEFPTVKCLNGTKSVGFNPFVSKTSHYQELTSSNGKDFNFINRDLDTSQIDFLEQYPGHTAENLKEFCNFLPGKEFVHVGLQPPSCLIEYYDGEKKKILETKKGGSVLLMDRKSYNKCASKAQLQLEKDYSFSNVTGKEFCINLRPQMNSTVQTKINEKISTIKKSNNTKYDEVLKGLTAKGFSNFYINHPCPSNEEFDNLYKGFQTKKFYFNGTLEVKYMQIKKPDNY